MVGFAPRATIDGPDRLPMPFGLFSVASLAETATERWENGVNWEAVMCGDPLSVLVSDCDPAVADGFPKQFPDGPGTGSADPFTVYGTYKCSGPQAVAVAQERAREVLDLGEEKAAERRLWSKMDDSPEVLTASDPLVAVARLEKWLADNYGSLGVIHMSRAAATVAAKRAAFRVVGNRLVTALGTPVVAGAGYPGTGPGIDEVQTVTVTPNPDQVGFPSSGTFTLSFGGETTEPIAWNAPAQAVADALNALDGVQGVTAEGGPLGTSAVTVTFPEDENIAQMTSDGTGLTNASVATATTTEGGIDAADTDTEFVAASPAIFGYRSEVFEQTNGQGDLFDRSNNNMFGIAERTYLLGMDPCGVAFVQMNLLG